MAQARASLGLGVLRSERSLAGATRDEAIPPDAERQFAKRMGATTIGIPSNHCAIVSHPDQVAELIETAAKAVTVPGEAVAV